jgi:hypothetical protein
MRALCEYCNKPQPPDWRSGDLCVWCGKPSRREVRCFWCARWTPEGKFCRTCGAGIVEPALYGAARMLKDAGSDRFAIPRQLAEFDPDQIENFTRIYQEHAAVAEMLLLQVDFLQERLEQKHWAAALDQTLVPQLPWPLEQLESLRDAARKVPAVATGLARAQAIFETTPIPATRTLAVVARVAFDDWSALDAAVGLLSDTDEAVRTEALLAVSHWRVLYAVGLPGDRYRIIAALQACPLREAASVRLALLGEAPPLPLPPGEFATALVAGDIDLLAAAAAQPDDPLRQFAAARKLIESDRLEPVRPALEALPVERQVELLRLLNRLKKPAPALRDTLYDLAARAADKDVRRWACHVLRFGCPPEEAVRIARLADGDTGVYQALLQTAELTDAALDDLGAFLIQANSFRMSQFGLSDTAAKGRMPADFVPRHWSDADSGTRVELCRYAEAQLRDYGDDALHHFLVGIAFAPGDTAVVREAWSCLYRWYNSFGFPRLRPLTIGEASITEFYKTPDQFLIRFTTFLEGREFLRETLHRDEITELLNYPDPSALPLLAAFPREGLALIDTLASVMLDQSVDLILRLACTDFVAFLGSEPVFRTAAVEVLKSVVGSDLYVDATRFLERFEES